jgi:hypothetical protein
MKMPTDLPDSLDCQATAAVLSSGGSIALAGHVAAVAAVVSIRNQAPASWMEYGSLLVWCGVVYLAVRVKIDTRFFEMLAVHPAEHLDEWLDIAGLRKKTGPRTIQARRRGALALWRALAAAVAMQIGLMLLGMLRRLA